MALVQTDDGGYVAVCNVAFAYAKLSTSGDGYVMAGLFGDSGIVLMKIDSLGKFLWNQTLVKESTPEGDYPVAATSMTKTSDGGYAIGGFIENDSLIYQTDLLMLKANSQGRLEWSKTFGGAGYDEATSIVQTADNGFALAGFTSSFVPYDTNFCLVKPDSSGNLQWAEAYGINILGHKNRYGNDEGLNNGAGDNIAKSLIQTGDRGYALFGDQGAIGGGYYPWLIKTDSNGNVQWNQTYNGGVDFWQYGYSVVQTGDGGFALAATDRTNPTNGPYQVWLIKTDTL